MDNSETAPTPLASPPLSWTPELPTLGSSRDPGMPAELSAARGRSSAGEGQLGDGTNTDRNAPTLIDAGTSYARIAAYSTHSCRIVSGTGALKCWGYNNDGELGDNTTSRRDSPVLIDSSTSYSAVSVGTYHSCGITTANLLKCWGSNTSGQLGSGTQSSYSTPTNVSLGISLSKLELANEFTCGMDNEGAVFCWGMNASGQLGDGSLLDRSFPTRVDPTRRYSQLSAKGSHACGIIKTTGALPCWGRNNSGQVGDGTTTNRATPASIDPGTSYAQISTGPSHTCGIVKGTGALKCWGDNAYGKLGDNTTTSRNLPTWIDPGTSYSAVATASEHTCGIVSDTGALKCWGRNNKGQLGDGTTTNRSTPATIDAGTSYSQISAQDWHACGVVSGTRALKCWGANTYSQLGTMNQRTVTPSSIPLK